MNKVIAKNKLLVIIILCFFFVASYSNVFAWGGYERHYYRDGGWHRHGWFGFDVTVSALTIGAVIESLPLGYRTEVVAGVPYYYYGGYYYRQYPYGYVVVPEPIVVSDVVYAPVPGSVPGTVTQPQGNAVTINIPNSKGGYISVALIKHKSGYIGPQGEYYEGHPSVEQLKALYGK